MTFELDMIRIAYISVLFGLLAIEAYGRKRSQLYRVVVTTPAAFGIATIVGYMVAGAL